MKEEEFHAAPIPEYHDHAISHVLQPDNYQPHVKGRPACKSMRGKREIGLVQSVLSTTTTVEKNIVEKNIANLAAL